MIPQALHRFLRADESNLSALFALSLIPVFILIGMTVDFTLSSKRKAILDALADFASLAAVTPVLLSQNDNASITEATNLFNAQASSVTGIGSVTLSVSVQDSGLSRSVTVTYNTTSKTLFGGLIGKSSVPLAGTSQSKASVPPNIDFYLLLDNSPSMAIAATTSGINTMVANTPDQCAFGCHETDTKPDDYYGLARSLGVTLRMDLLRRATQDLMTTAKTTATGNNAKYRAAVYTFNYGFNTVTTLTSNLSSAKSQAANIDVYEVPYQNWNSDAITNYTNGMNQINSTMPNPGNGTNQSGDTPQEVMFFVTDGVQDQMVSGSRVQALMNPSYCTTIKNRGIRIAVLYTTYLPLPTNAWYVRYIAPFQPNIGPNLQSCASAGLYYAVTTDQDISAALINLFHSALATAHLTM
jgi:Flp pilus assembly protein TadG